MDSIENGTAKTIYFIYLLTQRTGIDRIFHDRIPFACKRKTVLTTAGKTERHLYFVLEEIQRALLNLLEEAKRKNIGNVRTPISIARFIKLKTGDTFRFSIAHEQRHFIQAGNASAAIRKATGKCQAIHPAV